MTLALGLVAAALVQVVLCVRAWRDHHVPAYVTVLVPLALIVGARRGFAWLDPTDPVEPLVAALRRAAWVGPMWVVLGASAAVAGIVPRGRGVGRGAPALVQTGAVMVAVGFVWRVGLQGQAALWAAEGASVPELVRLQAAIIAQAEPRAWLAIAVLATGWLVSSAWGWRRYRMQGLGEGLAAAALVALVLGTGRPAREAMARVNEPVRSACADIAVAAGARPTLPSGTLTPLYDSLARSGPRGLERWTAGEWRAWDGLGGRRVLWLADPQQTVAALNRDLEALPQGVVVTLAGLSTDTVAVQPVFSGHPVLASRQCRSWPRPVTAEQSRTVAQTLPRMR